MNGLTVTVEFQFDPIEVQGYGMYSSQTRTQKFRASGVRATRNKKGTSLIFTGSKGDRQVRDGFFSNDDALASVRIEARLRAAAAYKAAEAGR